MQSDYGNLGNESKSDSTLYKYEKLNGGDHSTHVKRPSLKESVLSNHFSVTRGHDEKIVIQWENINYTMLVKGNIHLLLSMFCHVLIIFKFNVNNF